MDRLISERAVIESIEFFQMNPQHFDFVNLIDDIKEIPSAEPKTGHWKRISMDKYTEHAKHWYECDKCGEHNLGDTNFCPNCGARMVEPTCDTCEYNTAAFNPCNACKDKSEYKPQESENT